MFRTTDVEFVNSIVNHPEVFKFVSVPSQDYINTAPLVESEDNVVIGFDGGCFIFVMLEPGLYEVHSQFLPTHRGKYALRCAREAVEEMFLSTECMEIVTKVPEHNLAAKGLTDLMGFDLEFVRPKSYPTDAGMVDCAFYSLTYAKWAKRAKMDSVGKWFHDGLESEKIRLGIQDQHDDDDEHDNRVGIAIRMAQRGQPVKAEWLYNRWAKFAGYEQINLLNTDPLVVDIKEAIVKIGEKVEVLKCQ